MHAQTRELDHLLTEEVPLAVADMLRVLTVPSHSGHVLCVAADPCALVFGYYVPKECIDDLKGDTEEENRNREAQETLEQERARLRKKVASNLDSMLKYGLKVKEKEEEEPKPPAGTTRPTARATTTVQQSKIALLSFTLSQWRMRRRDPNATFCSTSTRRPKGSSIPFGAAFYTCR